jgi:hypothetical protein
MTYIHIILPGIEKRFIIFPSHKIIVQKDSVLLGTCGAVQLGGVRHTVLQIKKAPKGKKSPIFEILFDTLSMFNSVMLMVKTLHRRANIQGKFLF